MHDLSRPSSCIWPESLPSPPGGVQIGWDGVPVLMKETHKAQSRPFPRMILGAGGLAGDAGAVATILADVVRDYVCVQTFPGNPEAVGRFVEASGSLR